MSAPGIDPTPRDLGRGAWIGYAANRHGYTVTVYDPDSNEVYRYDAGNSPFDSQGFVPDPYPGEKAEPRLSVATLRKFARQTAQEMANEWGVSLAMIHEEESEVPERITRDGGRY